MLSIGFLTVSSLNFITAQTLTSSQTYEVTQSADFSPEFLVDLHLNDNALADQVFNHGCFCSKIYHWNDRSIRGGHVSVDEFDEICKNWFRTRECNDKHVGGSCHDGNVNPKTTDYTYDLVQNFYDDGSVTYDCSSNTEACALDTCIVDVEYLEQISTYLDSVSGSFNATSVNRVGDCPRSTERVVERFCNGTAPDFYTTKQVTTGLYYLIDPSSPFPGTEVSNSGLLKIRHPDYVSGDTRTGFVCDDFDGNQLALYACRSLGYNGVVSFQQGYNYQFAGSNMRMDNPGCPNFNQGAFYSLDDCSELDTQWGNHNCGDGETFFVTCN